MCLIALPAFAQERPSEDDLFGSDDTPEEVEAAAEEPDAGTSLLPDEVPATQGGEERDQAQLSGDTVESKFDTAEVESDPLRIGGNLLLFGQAFWQENRPFVEGAFSAPMLLDVYMDGRPTDRLRAYVQGRLQFDPTRPVGDGSTAAVSAPTIGVTPATASNPTVLLDQLWLRFDIARYVYLTIGRQKVRWGVSRIWYPTDFLNSQPRDAFNPFDVRLGVNMLKVHVPVESLGWNFYGYGLLEGVEVDSTGMKLMHLGGALRGEFVIGPAEFSASGVWQHGKRPRYAVDVSTALGPIDVYGEVAFRSGKDFVYFSRPSDLTQDNLVDNVLLGNIRAERGDGILVQVSGGASFTFNYTDKNMAIISAEYFFNPAGYDRPVDYITQTFGGQFFSQALDPIQRVPLYQGKHNVGLTIAAPGIPGADWITVSLSNVLIISDPAGLTRLDVIFRVLNYLTVQAFGSVFYGQTGGQLRFALTGPFIGSLANVADQFEPGSGDSIRDALLPLRDAPIVQAGLMLRLSI